MMETREWIFVVSIVVAVAFVLFLASRWRRRRYDDIKSADGGYSIGGDDPLIGAEDIGGVRTVGYREQDDIERMNEEIRDRANRAKPRLSSFRPEPTVQQSLLPDADVQAKKPASTSQTKIEEPEIPLLLDPSDEHNPSLAEPPVAERVEDVPEPGKAAGRPLSQLADELQNSVSEDEPELDFSVSAPERSLTPEASASKSSRSKSSSSKSPGSKSTATESSAGGQRVSREAEISEIIIVNLMRTPSEPYEGQALKTVLLELGLRFGEMDIFHYCGRHGNEAPQFRLANLLKPGYFDIENMNKTQTHALCFFFELEPGADNMKIYERMLTVINKVRDELGGTLHDENRSVFTIQTSEHCRNRIRDFQRRHLLNH